MRNSGWKRMKRWSIVFWVLVAVGAALLSSCTRQSPGGATASPTASFIGATPGLSSPLAVNIVPTTCPLNFLDEETEGPFYKAGSPQRTNLIENGIAGDSITLTGYVFDKDCNPVSGAWLDFWQADGNGNYDNSGYHLRGHQFTDAQGKYTLQTVMPAEYSGRTNHIHVKVSKSQGTPVITSQLYFPGSNLNETDNIFNESMLVTWGESSNGQKTAFFNFKLNQ